MHRESQNGQRRDGRENDLPRARDIRAKTNGDMQHSWRNACFADTRLAGIGISASGPCGGHRRRETDYAKRTDPAGGTRSIQFSACDGESETHAFALTGSGKRGDVRGNARSDKTGIESDTGATQRRRDERTNPFASSVRDSNKSDQTDGVACGNSPRHSRRSTKPTSRGARSSPGTAGRQRRK